jgi:hypothetical protein
MRSTISARICQKRRIGRTKKSAKNHVAAPTIVPPSRFDQFKISPFILAASF